MRRTGPTSAVVNRVLLRDGWRCIRCGEDIGGTRGWDWSLHHRRGRDGKPDSHEPQNLITVCGAGNVDRCHGFIHQHRGEAQENGWWLSRVAGADPLRYGILVAAGSRWCYLTATGEYHDEPPGLAA